MANGLAMTMNRNGERPIAIMLGRVRIGFFRYCRLSGRTADGGEERLDCPSSGGYFCRRGASYVRRYEGYGGPTITAKSRAANYGAISFCRPSFFSRDALVWDHGVCVGPLLKVSCCAFRKKWGIGCGPYSGLRAFSHFEAVWSVCHFCSYLCAVH